MRFGLLGRKLAHSYSPQIHALLGSYDYELFEKEPQEVEHFLKYGRFDGLNVTIPYKQTVIEFMSALTPTAQKIGAVNTVTRLPNGDLLGDNTDFFGFSFLLDRAGFDVSGRKVLVLGSGGASKTAVCVCRERGAKEAVVISRTGENNYDNISKHSDADFIVNATPVGMYPFNGASPIDLTAFKHLNGVADMIYNPAKTALLQQAESLGIAGINGLTMLCAQAAKAAESFTGEKISTDTTEQVIKKIERSMKNIVLVGMPGSGKSVAAAALAHTMGREVLDTDALIEDEIKMPIAEIFAAKGEAYFREAEANVCEQVGKLSGKIIATGGGAVLKKENRAVLGQNATVVFLKRELSSLETEGRPLSRKGKLEEMYKKRLPLYEAASDFSVEVDADCSTTAKRILKGFENS